MLDAINYRFEHGPTNSSNGGKLRLRYLPTWGTVYDDLTGPSDPKWGTWIKILKKNIIEYLSPKERKRLVNWLPSDVANALPF